MKKTASIVYSILGTLLVLEILLTSWTIAYGESLLVGDAFSRDFGIRMAILIICSLSLLQVYFLHIKGKNLSSISYWLILGFNSGITVYLKYIQDFVNADHLKINVVLYYTSFFNWVMLVLLGVLFKTLYHSLQGQRAIA